MWYRLFLTLTLLLLSPSAFSDEGTVVQPAGSLSHDPVEGYVAPGNFYWTRLYWKGTQDAATRGALYFVDENGNQSRTNLFLIAGMNATARHAVRYHEKALESLETYLTPSEVLPQREDLNNFQTAFEKAVKKPWGLVTHKVDKIKGNVIRDYNDMGNSDLAKWGLLGRIGVTVWNGLQIVGETIGIVAVELPLEFALRVVPKYWIGASLDAEDGVVIRNGVVTSLVQPVLRPVLPVLGAAWYWGVLEPSNLALRGGPSVGAGAVGTLLTGVTAAAEGGKFLVWDSWHPLSRETALYQTKDGRNVGFVVPVPKNEHVDNAVKVAFENATDRDMFIERFEQIIAAQPKDKQWVAMSYIVSRLSETIHSLYEKREQYAYGAQTPASMQIQNAHLTEAADLVWLKDVYAWALKEEMEWKGEVSAPKKRRTS